MLHAALLAHDDRQIGDQPGRVHRAVRRNRAVERAIGIPVGNAVSESPVHALPLGESDRVLVDGVQHLFIVGEQVILAKEEIAVAPLPRHHPVSQLQLQRLGGDLPGELANSGQVFGIAGRHQGQPIHRSPQVLVQWFLFQYFAGIGEDPLGFGAIVGRGVAVGPQDSQLELHFFGLAGPPAGQLQDASTGFRLGFLNRHRNALAGVVGEEFAAGAENYVVDFHHAIRRRPLPDMRDQNLPTGRRGPPLAALEEIGGLGVNPPAKPRGAEIVGDRPCCAE